MKSGQKQVGWMFWIWWTGLTITGGLAGTYFADLLSAGTQSQPTDAGILFSMLESGIFALLVSAAQWFLLWRLFTNSAWWLVAGTFGRALGMLIGSMTIVIITHQFNLQAGLWSTCTYLALRGAVLGASQWLVLKQWRTKAGWSVLANAVGWMLGPILMGLFIPSVANTAPIIGDFIAVAMAGAVTGAVMVWILRQPTPASMKETGGSRLIVTWISVWAISWGVSWAVGWSIVRDIIGAGYILEGGKIGGMVAGGIAGLVGGVGTAVVLKMAKPSNGLRIYHLVLIALGWASIVYYDWLQGFVIAGLPVSQNKYGIVVPALSSSPIKYGMSGPLSGLVGGVLTALILLWSVRSLDWKQLCVIVFGWASGFAIGGWILWTIGFQIALNYVKGPTYGSDPGISSLILFTIISLLCGAFAGWIGGVGTLKQIRPKLPRSA